MYTVSKNRNRTILDETQICNLYTNHNKTIKEIGRIIECNNIKRIIKILDSNNINHDKRKYALNQNTFRSIDTPEKAYLLGFIYADGTVSGNVMSIGQSGDEHKILYKFKDILKTNKPIYKSKKHKYHKKQPYVLSITSKKIINDLLAWGVMPAKSFKIRFPKQLNKNLMSHFIRGCFDGDGYFSIKKNRKATGFWALCSNEKFCQDIQQELKSNNIASNIYKNKRQKISELRIGKFTEISKLYQLLYNNSNNLFIPRKHDKFIELFSCKSGIK